MSPAQPPRPPLPSIEDHPLDPSWGRVATLLVGLSQQLGGIDNKLENVIEEQTRARDSRNDMYRRFEAFAATAATVARIAPMVEQHESDRQQLIGASKFGSVIGKVAHIVSAAIGGVVVWFLQHYFGPR